jgi:hypothetical protein
VQMWQCCAPAVCAATSGRPCRAVVHLLLLHWRLHLSLLLLLPGCSAPGCLQTRPAEVVVDTIHSSCDVMIPSGHIHILLLTSHASNKQRCSLIQLY